MKAVVIAASLITAYGPRAAITSEQALRIVQREVFRNDPKMGLSRYHDRNNPTFYFVEAAWDNRHGSMIGGHYAVNSRTATLWSVEGSVCRVLTTDRLAKFQETLRQTNRMDRSAFVKASSKRPIECSIVGRTRDARAY